MKMHQLFAVASGQDFLGPNTTGIVIALIGIIPGVIAYVSARKAKKSVELAGSDVTVKNWNQLIKNLYSEIDRLTQVNEADRKRAMKREAELEEEIGSTKARAAAEKAELLAQIKALRDQINTLEKRVSQTLDI